MTNDENNEEENISNKKLDNDRPEVYKLRSKQTEEKEISEESKESDQDNNDEINIPEKSELDESLKAFLWDPTEIPPTRTTITEVTDQTGVTVLIREVNESSSLNFPRAPRFLGYGNGGRGGKH